MPRLRSALSLAAILAASSAAALADTYSFTISTDTSSHNSPAATFVASGTLTGNASTKVNSGLDLTGVTGSAQGYSFAGVAPVGTPAPFAFDNLVYTDPTAQHVDSTGVLLYLNSPIGISLAHVYEGASGYEVDVLDPNDPGDLTPFAIQSFTLTPSAVPEPATLALLGTGALGVFGLIRRRVTR